MNNILLNNYLDLQEENMITDTLERVEEINKLVENENLPDNFELDKEGLWFKKPKKKETDSQIRIFISSPLRVTACARDHLSENHGRILEFNDIDGHKHIWAMPMELLANDGGKILAKLLNMGLRISPQKKAKEYLLEYITLCQPIRRARCVSQTGWFNGVFVLPFETIGFGQGEKIIYQNNINFESNTRSSGSLDDWRIKISTKACGNSRLILTLSAGFTGPILRLMNHENIGIYFRGNSSLGKSTAGIVANSIWGGKKDIYTFRATANGLEGIASLYNDRLLSLDELGQLSPYDAGSVFYMLGNGTGKIRSNKKGLPKKCATWHLVFLSNGELSLWQLLEEGGKRVKAGQEVRFIEISADTGCHGLFENLHEFENGAAFSDYLRDICSELYGTASKEFLKQLVKDLSGAIEYMKVVIEGMRQRFLPENASGQVIRVFNHFVLIAASGELASHFGITGWKAGEASKGVMKCFEDWLNLRGDNGMQEEQFALTQIRKFFELHGESRFSSWDSDLVNESRTIKRVGFKRYTDDRGIEFYVFVTAFRKEICSRLDYRYVEKICIKHNLLLPSSDGSPTRPERFPGNKSTTRCYRFTPEVLSGKIGEKI
ncbi:MAG: DUF927 domain-containing protein [Candidatus Thorarchaeota archaeon]